MAGWDLRGVSIAISAISFTLNLIVLCLLVWKGGRSRPAYLWWAFMGLITLWSFSEMFIRMTDDFYIAIAWFRFVVFSGALIPAILLHFTLEFPKRHPFLRKRTNRTIAYLIIYVPTILLLIKAEIMSFVIGAEPMTSTIWGKMYARDFLTRLVAADVYVPHYFFLAGMIFTGIFFILRGLGTTQGHLERKQLNMVAWALSIVFIPGVIFDAVLSIFLNVYTEIFSVLISFLGIVTAIAMVKYKFLIISPGTEDFADEDGNGASILPGYGYIVPTTMRTKGIAMFHSALAQKKEGIVITNKDPAEVRAAFGIKRTPIIYMGEKTGNEMRIDPENLDGLIGSVSVFTGIAKSPVLMVDWDFKNLDIALKKGRSGKGGEMVSNLMPFTGWFQGGTLWDTIEKAGNMLSGGMSIIILTDTVSDRVIRSQRPLQHIGLINFFIIENLLGKIHDAIEEEKGQGDLFLKELATADPFFDEWTYKEGIARGPFERISVLDRKVTVAKLQTIRGVLSRSTIKGVQGALPKVWKMNNLGGYIDEEISLHEGGIYFLASDDQSNAFDIARELVAVGHQGLCMSTRPPAKIQDLYGLKDVEYKWMTTSKTESNLTVPLSLEHIVRDLRSYIKDHNEGFVMLDGIELLISWLGFENVERFLHVLKDEIAETKIRMLIPVHPKAIEEQKLVLLRREVEV